MNRASPRTRRRPGQGATSFLRVGTLGLAGLLTLVGSPARGEDRPAELYQDFRGSQKPQPFLTLVGPDAHAVARPESGGLRITALQDGRQTYGWGVEANFSLSGDFEMTGAYELLAVEPPTKGGGAGVVLTVTADRERTIFAKVGRFLRMKEGDVYAVEYWNKKRSPPEYKMKQVPTQTRAGQLRLVREGSELRYLVADGPGEEFQELFRGPIGTDSMTARFLVNNNASPTALEARLVDLRIRSGGPIPARALDPPQEPPRSRWKIWLAGAILGLMIVLSLGAWLYVRRGHHARSAPAPDLPPEEGLQADKPEAAVAIACQCPGCGKGFKARAQLAGKKVKCSQCGRGVLVPEVQGEGSRHSPG